MGQLAHRDFRHPLLGNMHRVTGTSPDMRGDTEVPETIRKMVEAGHLGAKSGQGIYSYPPETIDEQIRQRDADYLSLVKLLHSEEKSA